MATAEDVRAAVADGGRTLRYDVCVCVCVCVSRTSTRSSECEAY